MIYTLTYVMYQLLECNAVCTTSAFFLFFLCVFHVNVLSQCVCNAHCAPSISCLIQWFDFFKALSVSFSMFFFYYDFCFVEVKSKLTIYSAKIN
jgi:hypothetical protein